MTGRAAAAPRPNVPTAGASVAGSGHRAIRNGTFWDKRARHYDAGIQNHDALYLDQIRKTSSLLKDADVVLDFACASGEISLDIAPHVQQVHGVDLSERMIELAGNKARRRRIDNAVFSRTDVFDPRLVGRSYSAILAFNIFHLLDDAPRVLDRLHELLSPGGLLISITPCLGHRSWLFRSLIKVAVSIGVAPLVRELTVADLESLVSRNFEVVESDMWDERYGAQWVLARKL